MPQSPEVKLPELRGPSLNREKAEALRESAIERFPPLAELMRDNKDLHWISWWIEHNAKSKLRSWRFWKEVADNTKNKKLLARKIEKEMSSYNSAKVKAAKEKEAEEQARLLVERLKALNEKYKDFDFDPGALPEDKWETDPAYDMDRNYNNF